MRQLIIASVLSCALLVGQAGSGWTSDEVESRATNERGGSSITFEELVFLANKGEAEAQFLLGDMYHHGKGVPQNLEVARQWYWAAAGQGHAMAQFLTGYMFQTGSGVAKNDRAAVIFYAQAAEQGLSIAQNRLGDMFLSGLGVPQDYGAAAKWYKRAAEQGNPDAQVRLSSMYALGRGVKQDDVYALMWANIAVSSGKENGIEYRNIVVDGMSPSQIEKAQKLALECIAKNYKSC